MLHDFNGHDVNGKHGFNAPLLSQLTSMIWTQIAPKLCLQDMVFMLVQHTPFTPPKDSFITQDRNEDFEGGQVESTFSRGDYDQTSVTISKNRCLMKDMDIIFP